MKRFFYGIIMAALLILPRTMCRADSSDLDVLDGVTLLAHPANDGDSFRVLHEGRELLVRLYYVDSAETSAASETDARRVRGQTRYFGLDSHSSTIHFGREATTFTRTQLEKPFRIYTKYATAPGRSSLTRFYVFVQTANGEDLAKLLVENGYARAFGVRRSTPRGVSAAEWAATLSDYENVAMLERRGIWAATDAQYLVSMRAEDRRELGELKAISKELLEPVGRIDVNVASLEELLMLPGVGPVTAQRIVDLRPYRVPDDLLRVPLLTTKSITKMQPYLEWNAQP